MKKIRWGILSTAKIGVEKVIPAMQNSEYCEVVAIASRSLEKSRLVAGLLDIPKTYGSYEALLEDPNVDAVYIPLPNHLHVSWSIKALEADKHVLCEKPIGLNGSEVQRLMEAAEKKSGQKVMEAFMYRFHPQWKRARQLVVDGRIGTLQTIHSFFSYHNADPDNIRNKAEIGGGGLMDIGCYCVSLSRFIFGTEPQSVCAVKQLDGTFKTDRLTSGVLEFGEGTSMFACATQLVPYQRVNIFGTEGRIEIEIPFNAPPDRPCRMVLQKGTNSEEIIFKACNQYTLQCDAFSRSIIDDKPVPTSLEDAMANMRVIDNITRSAETGSWVQST